MDSFRSAVREMTVDDRDNVTDVILLAMVSVIAGDIVVAQAHLETLPPVTGQERRGGALRALLRRIWRSMAH
jgi:hypothetical protein